MKNALLPLAFVGMFAAAGTAGADSATPSEARWIRPPRPVPAVSVELLDSDQRALRTFTLGARRYVLGSLGQRYRLRVRNPTAARAEVVVSVDGLDALDGQPASLTKRGYLVPAFGDVVIDGWRTSMDSVAAFRFSSVHDSYAARSDRERNVGVIGVAVFRERPPVVAIAPPMTRSAGGGPAPSAAPASKGDRSGLGTRFGEQHESHVTEVAFERADPSPSTTLELRYNDEEGLRALGIELPRDTGALASEIEKRESADPFPDSRFALPPR